MTMSIRGDNNEDVVTMHGIWGVALKVALTLAVPVLLTLISLGTWTVVKIFEHDTRLALIEHGLVQAAVARKPPKNDVAKNGASEP